MKVVRTTCKNCYGNRFFIYRGETCYCPVCYGEGYLETIIESHEHLINPIPEGE